MTIGPIRLFVSFYQRVPWRGALERAPAVTKNTIVVKLFTKNFSKFKQVIFLLSLSRQISLELNFRIGKAAVGPDSKAQSVTKLAKATV